MAAVPAGFMSFFDFLYPWTMLVLMGMFIYYLVKGFGGFGGGGGGTTPPVTPPPGGGGGGGSVGDTTATGGDADATGGSATGGTSTATSGNVTITNPDGSPATVTVSGWSEVDFETDWRALVHDLNSLPPGFTAYLRSTRNPLGETRNLLKFMKIEKLTDIQREMRKKDPFNRTTFTNFIAHANTLIQRHNRTLARLSFNKKVKEAYKNLDSYLKEINSNTPEQFLLGGRDEENAWNNIKRLVYSRTIATDVSERMALKNYFEHLYKVYLVLTVTIANYIELQNIVPRMRRYAPASRQQRR